MSRTETSRLRRWTTDGLVTAVAFALTLGSLHGGGEWRDDGGGAGDVDLDALGVLLAAAATLPLLGRRHAPLAVFATTATASALLSGLGYPPGPPIGPTVALFSIGLYAPTPRGGPRVTALVVAVLFGVHLAATGIGQDEVPVVPALVGSLVWGGAWVIGDRVRQRRERTRQGEREAQRELRLAVAEERTRIARDLHDSAGHALNVILVQAGAARLLGERDPDRARAALATIEEVARETVGEIDRLVHVLRENGASDAVAPPVGLAALDTLVDRHRTTGLEVAVRIEGEPRPLSRAVDQAAYRIVQEALTNAGRHGGPTAELRLAYASDALTLSVTNPLQGGVAGPPGHGIAGMRERAALLGGRLDARAEAGIFEVTAELPYERSDR